ncbi:MAG TPA: polyhydroxyalkanoate synthesis regulator DNA-binding domain-containing protein [Candidatus Koribacter sp.]
MALGPVIIKKYGNRRLYDTSSSSYVNLEDLAKMVRNGTDLKVVDASSGEDLTRVTLTQIIVEDAKDQPSGLPLELLKQLIVASDHAGREFIMWYLRSAFEAYQKMQGALQSGFTGVMSPVDTLRSFLRGPEKPEATESDELRRRLAELEARVAAPPVKKKRAHPTKKKPAKKRQAR